jgi:hypothetical protein
MSKNTNINIVAGLLQSPTAVAFDSSVTRTNSTVTAGGITYNIIISDSNTTVSISKGGSKPSADWNGYIVTGINPSASSGNVTFDSNTSKLASTF